LDAPKAEQQDQVRDAVPAAPAPAQPWDAFLGVLERDQPCASDVVLALPVGGGTQPGAAWSLAYVKASRFSGFFPFRDTRLHRLTSLGVRADLAQKPIPGNAVFGGPESRLVFTYAGPSAAIDAARRPLLWLSPDPSAVIVHEALYKPIVRLFEHPPHNTFPQGALP
jgi:hypothetical protein